MAAYIPIVDFTAFNNVGENFDESNLEIRKLSQEICDAFTTVGFVYIKNHGIPESEISRLLEAAKKFFELSLEEKNVFARKTTNHGYVGYGVERIDPSKPVDSKEAFNVTEPFNEKIPWPDDICSDFKPNCHNFFRSCEKLALVILDLIALGLKLEDRKLFLKTHSKIGTAENATTLRLLYYPIVTELKEGQLRLGEHSDYGTITLLFQDDVGGLEVKSKMKGYVPAHPIEGTILVNIGDLLQRWTNDKLVSTKHRVVVPHRELLCSKARQSAAFFVHPDNDVVVECLDGSNHYPAITADDYLMQRLSATYL